jgi:hypothetical protein
MKLIQLIYIISFLLNVINAFEPHFHHCDGKFFETIYNGSNRSIHMHIKKKKFFFYIGWLFHGITWDTDNKLISVSITGPDPVEIAADPNLRPYTTDANDQKKPYQQIWSGRQWVNGYDDRNFQGGHKGDNPWTFTANYDPSKMPKSGTQITWKMTLFYDCIWFYETDCLGCIWMLSTYVP